MLLGGLETGGVATVVAEITSHKAFTTAHNSVDKVALGYTDCCAKSCWKQVGSPLHVVSIECWTLHLDMCSEKQKCTNLVTDQLC